MHNITAPPPDLTSVTIDGVTYSHSRMMLSKFNEQQLSLEFGARRFQSRLCWSIGLSRARGRGLQSEGAVGGIGGGLADAHLAVKEDQLLAQGLVLSAPTRLHALRHLMPVRVDDSLLGEPLPQLTRISVWPWTVLVWPVAVSVISASMPPGVGRRDRR